MSDNLIEQILAHAKQAQLDPMFAKDQAWEIEQLILAHRAAQISKATHTCEYHGDNCQEHNLHCGYPKCQILRAAKAEQ